MSGSGDSADRRFVAPGDLDLDYARDLGDPGEFPYTRGIHRDMYAGRPWSIRQYAGFGTPEETDRTIRFLIGQGQAALSTAFDLPTQMGLDSDDPRALRRGGTRGGGHRHRGRHGGGVRRHPLDEVSRSRPSTLPRRLVAMYHVGL